MNVSKFSLFIVFLFPLAVFGQNKTSIISSADFAFLEDMTKSVLDSSRIRPGQRLPDPFGKNNTGGTLVRPGGRDTYPSFWIRDYAMTLESDLISREEQKHMLLLTASTQSDQTWITKGGSMVPFGAIADHIRVDDLRPVYFPGTYDYEAQGVEEFGMFPPYCDQFYFIHMAYYYVKNTSDKNILKKKIDGFSLIDRLEIAFKVPPVRNGKDIVYTTMGFRGVDFGFRDAIRITGDLSYPSILKYRAAIQLSELYDKLRNKEKAAGYREIAAAIKEALPKVFLNKQGMLLSSTGTSAQPDVWATALAVYLGILEGKDRERACHHLAKAYRNGSLAYKGSIRHVPTTDDFSGNTAWENAIVPKNTYQNGAYWGTPTGWVSYAISTVDKALAKQLISEYIAELRANDFRKGSGFSAPYECFAPSGYTRGPVYLTTVSCPYIVLKSMAER